MPIRRPLSPASRSNPETQADNTRDGSKGAWSRSIRPDSIREKSSTSSTSRRKWAVESRSIRPSSPASSRSGRSDNSWAMPQMPFNGVRMSWLIAARNIDFARLAMLACSAACSARRSRSLRSASRCSSAAAMRLNEPASEATSRSPPPGARADSSPDAMASALPARRAMPVASHPPSNQENSAARPMPMVAATAARRRAWSSSARALRLSMPSSIVPTSASPARTAPPTSKMPSSSRGGLAGSKTPARASASPIASSSRRSASRTRTYAACRRSTSPSATTAILARS